MYRVEWAPTALDALARFWTSADPTTRQAINSAANELDRRLQANPWGQGESRTNGRRVLFVAPLSATYRVHGDDQTVIIIYVHLFRMGPP